MSRLLIKFERNFDYWGRPAALCEYVPFPMMDHQLHKTLYLKTCPYCHGKFYGKFNAEFCGPNCRSSNRRHYFQFRIPKKDLHNFRCLKHNDYIDITEREAQDIHKKLHAGRYRCVDLNKLPKKTKGKLGSIFA